ncbi:hypothetical protein OAN96_01220 [Candidatus Gracilibacteria bacterium]|nr:hypothetical protein [Candidatus Gracilibacteria bacterium]
MQTTTLIITSNDTIYTQLVSKMNLQTNGDIATTSLEDSIIIAIKTVSPEAVETIIGNQVATQKVICVDTVSEFYEVEFKLGDVAIPNSVIHGSNAHFLEYAPSGDYDLEKFNLILNGTIGPKGSEEDEFQVDMVDENIFPITANLQKNDLLSKTIVLRGIGEESIENTLAIFEMVV